MLREMLHSLAAVPLALLLGVAVLVPVGLAVWLLGLDRPRSDRSDDNLVTSAIRFVGGAFALLSAFIIVSLASQASAARAAVRAEAAAADSFAREVVRLPAPHGPELRRGVEAYLQAVLVDEWPQMGEHTRTHDEADDEMDRLFDLLFSDQVAPPPGQYDARYALAVTSLDLLEESRVQRLLVARDPLSPVLWAALLVSAATMLVVAAVYPSGATRALKWVQLVTIGTVVAIVLFVVLSLEHAYHGFLAVEPTAFETVLQQLRG
jgi:hypothetical protein